MIKMGQIKLHLVLHLLCIRSPSLNLGRSREKPLSEIPKELLPVSGDSAELGERMT